ncbi:MAG: fumarylacetoacetate hydrolase family protein [Acidimicrobiales bacterium]
MRLVTIRTGSGTRAGRVEGDEVVLLDATDVRAVLEAPSGLSAAVDVGGPSVVWADTDLAPVIPRPDKTICGGKNYLSHIAEMSGERPAHPTYFTKYARTLIGARDPISLPAPDVSTSVDWEGELAIVIGSPVRDADPAEALAAIAGFTVLNDVSVRDWQFRTSQFMAGTAFEGTTPLGPWLVTRDEVGDGTGLELRTEVDGVVKQSANTTDMCFTPVDIVIDLSRIITLDPGDVIATGTPSGVGHAREPREYLTHGSVVKVSIEGVGEIENRCVAG